MKDVVEKITLGVLAGIGVIVVVVGIGVLTAWPIKWTWNATMPYLFSWPTITWGKAWCLYFLAGCLIRSSLHSSKSD